MSRIKRTLVMCAVPAASALLAYPLYKLQASGVQKSEGSPSAVSQLNAVLRGTTVRLPEKDHYGARIPKAPCQVELLTSCASCTAGTTIYALDSSYDKRLPLVVVARDVAALRSMTLRAKANVYSILEASQEYVPALAWVAAPISLVLDEKGSIVHVHNQRALYVANLPPQKVKK